MIRIHFSQRTPGRFVVPLAEVCGPADERTHDNLFERRFEDLNRQAPSLWTSVPLEQAQLVVYPHNYQAGVETDAVAIRARDAGLPCLFFDTTDFHTPALPPHGTVYRSAIFLSQITRRERAMPPICEDLLIYRDRKPQPRQKGPRAVVGFCGYLVEWWKAAAMKLRGEKDRADGHTVRRRAVACLQGSDLVQTNFLIRRHYWGGAVKANKDQSVVNQVRDEFVANMFECDYVLCARGAGNFSVRFYETLAAGRIPLLINTDCALPFSDRIDWRKHCVIVEAARINEAPRILANFHASLSNEQFLALQAANRALWDRYLNPLSFLTIAVDEAVRGEGPVGPMG